MKEFLVSVVLAQSKGKSLLKCAWPHSALNQNVRIDVAIPLFERKKKTARWRKTTMRLLCLWATIMALFDIPGTAVTSESAQDDHGVESFFESEATAEQIANWLAVGGPGIPFPRHVRRLTATDGISLSLEKSLQPEAMESLTLVLAPTRNARMHSDIL